MSECINFISIPENACPDCHCIADMSVCILHDRPRLPLEGAIAVCENCGKINSYNKDLEIIRLSDSCMRDLVDNHSEKFLEVLKFSVHIKKQKAVNHQSNK